MYTFRNKSPLHDTVSEQYTRVMKPTWGTIYSQFILSVNLYMFRAYF